MPPLRRSARVAARNAAQPYNRRAAFLRAVEAIPRRATITRSARLRARNAAQPSNRHAAAVHPVGTGPLRAISVIIRRRRNNPSNQRSVGNRLADANMMHPTLQNILPYRNDPGTDADAAEPANGGPGVVASRTLYRLRREFQRMTSDSMDGCTVELVDDSLYTWKGIILGPPDTPYEGGNFELLIHFTPGYPIIPPFLQFQTRIYHCNIHNGLICMNILGEDWSPALNVAKLLLSIRSLLADPNPDSPLNYVAAEMYKNNRKKHDQVAREWTNLYAKPVASPSETS